MTRSLIIGVLACLFAVASADAVLSAGTSRDLLQTNKARTQVAQQQTQAAIRQAVASGANPARTQGAANVGQGTTRLVARPAGGQLTTATAITTPPRGPAPAPRAAPRPTGTGKKLLQASKATAGGARATVAQAQTSAAIQKAVASGKPTDKKVATKVGTGTSKMVARPASAPIATGSMIVSKANGRKMLQTSRSGARDARATISQGQTSAAIKQATRPGAPPAKTGRATNVGTGTAKLAARPAGAPLPVATQLTNPRGM